MSLGMMAVDEARALVLAEATPLSVESSPLTQALGMVLATGVTAPHNVPPFDNSGMDGFAVRAADIASADAHKPVELRIIETVAAGRVASVPVGPGEAVRIMTGAPMPEGADAVIRVEDCVEEGDLVFVRKPVKAGGDVRRAGEDVRAGHEVFEPGTVLRPPEIGVLASLGLSSVDVHRRPRVAILGTGSELVEVDQPLQPGQIHNSNGYSLRAQCQQLGIEPVSLGIAHDDLEITKRLMAEGLEHDVLLTSGGVSLGSFDFVRDVQEALGVERRFWGVAMRPGRPLVFGVRGKTLVFGLPGNPVSAMLSFELFVRPALLRLMGHRKTTRALYKGIIAEDVGGSAGRVHVLRVRVWREDGVWHVSTTGPQGSGMLRSMVGANGIVLVPSESQGVKAGGEVDFMLLQEELVES